MELSLEAYNMLHYLPSKIAAAALQVSNIIFMCYLCIIDKNQKAKSATITRAPAT